MGYKLGIIGCGNMATAIVGGVLKANIYNKDEIIMSDISSENIKNVREKFDIMAVQNNDEVIEKSNSIIIAIKPQYFDSFCKGINDKSIIDGKLVISIMAGTKIEKIKKLLGSKASVVRVMPNTPAIVNEAMSAICLDNGIKEEDEKIVKDIFDSIGQTKILDENMIDAVTAISGSSPAYVFMMIEAMADAGVLLGLSREDAYIFASQSILGSSKMYLETKIHPAKLKDMVTSPSGTTIEALRVLEQRGFRSALIEAMFSCAKKSKDMQNL